MPDPAATYRSLTRLLTRHGFHLERIPGSHHLFVHPSGTTILLPVDESTRAAMPSQVAAVRRVLDERGLLPAEAFDAEVLAGGNGRVKAKS